MKVQHMCINRNHRQNQSRKDVCVWGGGGEGRQTYNNYCKLFLFFSFQVGMCQLHLHMKMNSFELHWEGQFVGPLFLSLFFTIFCCC